ncbi:D-arabinitol dehydrogenase 1 [Hondaea fermentalgiana]|uniref:D-arabinitol dehydrogenase 1 n=1 Tax=Hondaea fermentalgiana TaxID=2315210 RepID=A0A2R5GD70_9STRA|nr:D-arabinitol dehydrogenase 1 [Hondaea fermentalgiana]|eukprot:GBG26573.1 D-arabinitol dehydrogenase 1 [Hondaea fermentalgiana]
MKGVALRPGRGACVEHDLDAPRLPEDDDNAWALVRVLRAGICGTDLEMLEGYKGGFEGVFGHEFVGEVIEINPGKAGQIAGGDGGEITVGDRVVGEINLPCGKCAICSRAAQATAAGASAGDQVVVAARNHCPHRKCLGIVGHGGVFAEQLTLPVANLFRVDDSIPDELACFAEPLAAGCRVAEQLAPDVAAFGKEDASDTLDGEGVNIAVIGDGRLGLLVAAALLEQLASGTVTLFGRHETKMSILSSQKWSGARLQVVQSTPEAITSNASSFDVCVEATATPGGFAAAVQLTRPLGTVVLKSTCSASKMDPAGLEATLASSNDARSSVVVKELRVLGSRCGPFAPALRLLRESTPLRAVLLRMVDHVLYLDDFHDALTKAKARGALKVQLLLHEN